MLTSAQTELLSFQLKEWEGKSKTLKKKKKKAAWTEQSYKTLCMTVKEITFP